MRETLTLIRQWAERLGVHPFFDRMRRSPDLRSAMRFAPAGTFWVMTFQDIIRLNAEQTTDPVIRKIVERHVAEDSGHQEWFLDDLEQIYGGQPTSIRWLFSHDNRRVRAISFALAGEVFRITDDRQRLVLLEVLEVAASVYFGHISRFLAESGHAHKLKYFSGQHVTAEADHEMHETAHREQLAAIVIPSELRTETDALVRRMFATFLQLGDALIEQLDADPPARWHTFRALGQARLEALCNALGMAASHATAAAVLDEFMASWGDRLIGAAPAWHSQITDDHTPFELSFAIEDGRPELRFLIEVQGEPVTTLESSWRAGLAVNERLHHAHGVSLERFHRIEDLFTPRDPTARFAIWHAINLHPESAPEFKLYLNPRSHGADAAVPVVLEALRRLGFERATAFLRDHVLARPGLKVVYFSLDLTRGEDGRIKVYACYPGTTAAELESMLADADSGLAPGEASAFCRALTGHDGPYHHHALDVCYAFTDPAGDLPSAASLYVPVRGYVEHDAEAAARIEAILDADDRPLWRAVIGAVAHRRLDAGRGLVQWASVKRRRGRRRLTFYFTPEAYSVLPPRPHVPTGSGTR